MEQATIDRMKWLERQMALSEAEVAQLKIELEDAYQRREFYIESWTALAEAKREEEGEAA